VRLHVAGEVAGTCPRPLELYGLLGGRTVLYGGVGAAAEGRPFHLVSEALPEAPEGPQAVRVDLVDGAVLWYTAEVALSHDPV
jgi:hypothetical protein